MEDAQAPYRFDATLSPNRSLSNKGFMIVMGVLLAVTTALGLAFWAHGAWPVLGFMGLEVLVVFWAFRESYRQGRGYERLILARNGFFIESCDPRRGRQIWRMDPFGLRVRYREDPGRAGTPILISGGGRSFAVGAFLSPAERGELAAALQAALKST